MSASFFTPVGTTKNITAGTTTGSVALPVVTDASRAVRVYNAGAVISFVNFGASDVTAALTTSIPIVPGGTFIFEVGQKATHMAAITASSTAVTYVTEGFGSA